MPEQRNESSAATTEPESMVNWRREIIEAGIGYTLATGKLFTRMDEFHSFAERVLGRPILTHEFADTATWDDLRAAFEEEVTDAIG